MEIMWSYYLILALYIVVIVSKILNQLARKQFRNTYTVIETYKIFKSNFFTTVAVVSGIITLAINISAIVTNRPIVWSSIIITVLVAGMAILTMYNEIIIAEEHILIIDGTIVESTIVKEVVIKEKKEKTYYTIHFNKQLNGYESAEFILKGEQAVAFTEYIKTF
ncbi:MAG: hypothetical protein ACRCSG_07615 [Cellulosilyticaceae bacterium]